MEYAASAIELFDKMQSLLKIKPQKSMIEAMQGEAFVLHYVSRRGGNVLPGEISQEMDVSSARIAAALNSLEKKGLIIREIDRSDRRQILVAITQKGKNAAEDHYRTVLGIAGQMLELLGEDDAKDYVRIMKKLAEVLIDCEE